MTPQVMGGGSEWLPEAGRLKEPRHLLPKVGHNILRREGDAGGAKEGNENT